MQSDKAKGIIAKPMPRYWYDIASNQLPDGATDEEIAKRDFNLRIVADKKPYFMRYIYPTLMSQYKDYVKSADTNALRTFRVSLNTLLDMNEEDLSESQAEFLYYYRKRMPVSDKNCVMNRICRKFEAAFERSRIMSDVNSEFDYTFMKSGVEYAPTQYRAVEKLFRQYNNNLREYAKRARVYRYDEEENARYKASFLRYFVEECDKVCSDQSQLCDILLDICYTRAGSYQFVWDIAGDTIVENLTRNNPGTACLIEDDEGSIVYGGNKYSMIRVEETA